MTSSNGNSTANKYGYQSKELQEELGLDWYDFGARNYDASLGRWMNIDPLAEEFISYTPYNAMMNNPLSFIDPDGMFSTRVDENGEIIEHVDDGDDSIYLDTNPEIDEDILIVVGTEREDVDYVAGESIVLADLSEEGMDIMFSDDVGDGDVTIAKTETEINNEKTAEVINFAKSWAGLGDGTGTEAPQMLGSKGKKKGNSNLGAKSKKGKAGRSKGSEHTKNKRSSTKKKHQKGQKRNQQVNTDKKRNKKGWTQQ